MNFDKKTLDICNNCRLYFVADTSLNVQLSLEVSSLNQLTCKRDVCHCFEFSMYCKAIVQIIITRQWEL